MGFFSNIFKLVFIACAIVICIGYIVALATPWYLVTVNYPIQVPYTVRNPFPPPLAPVGSLPLLPPSADIAPLSSPIDSSSSIITLPFFPWFLPPE